MFATRNSPKAILWAAGMAVFAIGSAAFGQESAEPDPGGYGTHWAALAQRCEHAILGSVTRVESFWNAEGTSIYTDVEIRVEEDFKGNVADPAGVLILTEEGGTIGGITLTVEPAPTFSFGEQVLVFTERTPDGRLIVCGRDQGKLTLRPAIGIARDQAGEPVDKGEGVEQGVITYVEPAQDPVAELEAVAVGLGYSPVRFEDLAPDKGDGYGAPDSVGCSNFNGNYPTGTFSTASSSWATVSTCIYGGEYAYYSVTRGNAYEWSQCSGDGGSCSFDGELSLWDQSGTTLYAYSDDFCGDDAKITWTATFTGTVRVLVSQWNCQNNTTCSTLRWRCLSCGTTPSITSVSPTHAPAGVGSAGPAGSLVTITGTNFWGQGANDHVYFYYKSNGGGTADYVCDDAMIVSWTNVQIQCYVPVKASSKDVAVYKNGTWSNKPTFTVDWGYSGRRWPGLSKVGMSYSINQNGTPDVNNTDEFTAVRSAFETWDAVANCIIDHYWVYGLTTLTVHSRDYTNVVAWIENSWANGSNAIATCFTWTTDGFIDEFDIELNGQDYTLSDSGASGRMDIQNILTHEIGHGSIGLKDLYGTADSEKTMYGYSSTGETKKRSLDTQDNAAAQFVSCPAPAKPSGTAASDGTSCNYVRVSWNAVSGATGYRVHRSTSMYGTYTLLGTPTASPYDDYTAAKGVYYYYKVEATNQCGPSGIQCPSDYGYRKNCP